MNFCVSKSCKIDEKQQKGEHTPKSTEMCAKPLKGCQTDQNRQFGTKSALSAKTVVAHSCGSNVHFSIVPPRFPSIPLDSPRFSSILLDSPRFSSILLDSPRFSSILLDSPRFSSILLEIPPRMRFVQFTLSGLHVAELPILVGFVLVAPNVAS